MSANARMLAGASALAGSSFLKVNCVLLKYASKKPVQDYKSTDFKENFEKIKIEQS